MRDNQEMASILFNSNLATSDQLNESWGEITETKDIGQILVSKGILAQNVYSDLLTYIDSLHATPGGETQSAVGTSENDTDMVIEPDAGPTPMEPLVAAEEEIVEEETAPAISGLDEDAFVVDLGDVEPHRDDENPVDMLDPSAFSTIEMTNEPAQGEKVRDVVKKTGSKTISVADSDSAEEQLPELTVPTREAEELRVSIPETVSHTNTLDELLMFARSNDVSDLHLIPGSAITMRRFGVLHAMGDAPLSPESIQEKLLQGLPDERMETFQESGDEEFIYTIPGGGRFRVTIMKLRSGWSFTARIIPMEIRSFESIGLSQSAFSLTQWAQGLVLVTGPAGCGKSTTLSTLVETINSGRNEHIITIENPIETVFPLGQSQVTQRQIGAHTLSQENALRGALRQDPDILMVSELRDMESIQLAVSAAETGHLVFGTMNTTNAIRTINRLIESFPSDEQDVIRSMVSESLRGVISQQLIPKKDGTGVVPAFEVLLVTPAVANMIRKNEMHQLGSAMVTGRSQGMVLFDDSLMELVKSDHITVQEAYNRANEKELFEPLLKRGM